MFFAKSFYKIQKIKFFYYIHTTIEQILTMIVRKGVKVEICPPPSLIGLFLIHDYTGGSALCGALFEAITGDIIRRLVSRNANHVE